MCVSRLRKMAEFLGLNERGIEWSMEHFFASMRAVCLLLRARAVVKFFVRAASALENTDGEQRAL